jgi:hypothetical protein
VQLHGILGVPSSQRARGDEDLRSTWKMATKSQFLQAVSEGRVMTRMGGGGKRKGGVNRRMESSFGASCVLSDKASTCVQKIARNMVLPWSTHSTQIGY